MSYEIGQEFKSQFEAYKAMLAGFCVQDTNEVNGVNKSYTHKISDEQLLFWRPERYVWLPTSYLSLCGPFKIAPDPSNPEPKRLTFDEAVAAEKVTIHLPGRKPVTVEREEEWWYSGDLFAFDLADRRGWAMYEGEVTP